MKKPRASHRTRSPRIVQELVRLAVGLAASGSRIEDVFWENRLAGKIRAQLRTGDDQNLEAALDQLYDYDPWPTANLSMQLKPRSSVPP